MCALSRVCALSRCLRSRDTNYAENNMHQIWAELFAEPAILPLPKFELLVPGCGLIATVSELSCFLEF